MKTRQLLMTTIAITFTLFVGSMMTGCVVNGLGGFEGGLTCSAGGCSSTCQEGTDCFATCSGGNCDRTCERGSDCNFTCSGGDCDFVCEPGSRCTVTCSGGGCTVTGGGAEREPVSDDDTYTHDDLDEDSRPTSDDPAIPLPGDDEDCDVHHGCSDDDPDASGGPDNGGAPAGYCDPDFGPSDACGGELEGTWRFAAACAATDLVEEIEDTIGSYCPAATVAMGGDGDGTLTFQGGAVTRNGSYDAFAEVIAPKSCLAPIGGCDGAELLLLEGLRDAGAGSANCVESGSECECRVNLADSVFEGGRYTTGDGTIRVDGRTFDYCVKDGLLTATERSGGEEDFVQVYAR